MENDLQKYGIEFSESERQGSAVMQAEHSHDFYELYFLREGRAKYFVGADILYLKAGDFILVPKGALHQTLYHPGEYSARLLIYFTDAFVGDEYRPLLDGLSSVKLIQVSAAAQLSLTDLVHRIQTESAQREPGFISQCRNLLRALLLGLYRNRPDDRSWYSLSQNERTVQEAAQYLNLHYMEDLSLSDLAARYSMSPSHFSRCFRVHTGFGYREYVVALRIREAEKLMRATSLPLAEIATRCGFCDGNYFSAVFKRMRGVAPYRYAKQCRDGATSGRSRRSSRRSAKDDPEAASIVASAELGRFKSNGEPDTREFPIVPDYLTHPERPEIADIFASDEDGASEPAVVDAIAPPPSAKASKESKKPKASSGRKRPSAKRSASDHEPRTAMARA